MIPSNRRALLQAIDVLAKHYGTCRACGRRIYVYGDALMTGGRRFTASCHGSTETVEIDLNEIVSQEVHANRIGEWLRHLFTPDCQPDVMELLRYNRDPWTVNAH